MKLAPASKVSTRTYSTASRWEGIVLYLTGYLCTLIAIAAAQLSIDTTFTLVLAGVTLLGLPISLWLRWSNLRIGSYRIPRPLVNSIVVVIAIAASLCYLVLTNPSLFSSRAYQSFMVEQNAGEAIKLLMKTFLILATCRSLAIISDKDAVLCTVPSFSVLLLLIVVHRGPEVVVFFLMWSVAAAILFSLDHRAEARERVIGFVPAVIPGQDVSLSARGLASVMGFSLVCAVALSYMLTSRNPSDRSLVENWMITLASQFTQRALQLPQLSINAGPEQQIDFSSSPVLPSRTKLWEVRASVRDRTGQGYLIQPLYWRMFTLSSYNGKSWSQPRGTIRDIASEVVRRRNRFGEERDVLTFDIENALESQWNKSRLTFGSPRIEVRQEVRAVVAGAGFIPTLPAAREMVTRPGQGEFFPDRSALGRLNSMGRLRVRVRQEDHAISVGMMSGEQGANIMSEVPLADEYGTTIPGQSGTPPLHRVQAGKEANPGARLTPQERQTYLQLPLYMRSIESGVHRFVRQTLRVASQSESDYRRAQRLAAELQRDAVYTLRPPAVPEGRDATEFFLENRRGYCTYYASALAVLCRAAGIPARIVSGFAVFDNEGDALDEDGWVPLREANAHAWTEVWVPGWGWAVMDATPADNRGNNAPGWWENWTDLFGLALHDTNLWLHQNAKWLLSLVPLLLFITILIFGNRIGLTRGNSTFWKIRSFFKYWLGRIGGARFRAWLESADAEGDEALRRGVLRVYERTASILARRFRQRTPAETPHEWLDAAQQSLELSNPTPLQRLTDLYVQATYAPQPLPPQALSEARSAFNTLSWQRVQTEKKRLTFFKTRKGAASGS